MRISIFVGDLADAPASVICTSTNPHLTLKMGTGATVRERGGTDVLRACARIVEKQGGEGLTPGTVHATTAGWLPFREVIHCVATDTRHRSSRDIIRSCALQALRHAAARGRHSIALPLFAAGRARERVDLVVGEICHALRQAPPGLDEVVLVFNDRSLVREVRRAIAYRLPEAGQVPQVSRRGEEIRRRATAGSSRELQR